MENELELNQMLEMASGEVHDLLHKVNQLEQRVRFMELEREGLRNVLSDVLDLARTDLPIESFTPENWNVHRLHSIARAVAQALM